MRMREDPSRTGIFYGWWIVLAGGVTLMVTAGIGYYSFPVFLKPLEQEFGWSRAALSGPIGLSTLSAGVWLPIIGRLIDRYGPRWVMVPGALVMASCNLLLGRITELWHLYVIFLVIAPAVVAVTALPVQAVVSQWFVEKRGLAMGCAMVGAGLGGAIAPKLSHALISQLGWRTAYLVLALLIVALVIPVVALVVRHKPADQGLEPDGGAAAGPDPAPEAALDHPSARLPGLETRAALRTPAFWLLAAALFVTAVGGSYIILHLVAFATDVGIPAGSAATALSLLAGVSILGRLGFGALGDRLSKRTAIAVCFLVHAVGIALLLQVKSVGLLYLFAALYGLGLGGSVVVLPLLVAECFGVVSFAAINGLLWTSFTFGAAVGPVLAGRIFDVTGSYSLAYLIALLAFLVATVTVWFVPSPRRAGEAGAEASPEPALPIPATPAGPLSTGTPPLS